MNYKLIKTLTGLYSEDSGLMLTISRKFLMSNVNILSLM